MAVADRAGLPVAVHTAAAAPHEVSLVRATLAQVSTSERPRQLVGDRAYDSDPLDAELRGQGVELIASHRANRSKLATQDGRPIQRYRSRWKVERLFAWLYNFRRVAMRFDQHDENYLGFVHLADPEVLSNGPCKNV